MLKNLYRSKPLLLLGVSLLALPVLLTLVTYTFGRDSVLDEPVQRRVLDVEKVVAAAQALFDADEHYDLAEEHCEMVQARLMEAEEAFEEARHERRVAAEALFDALEQARPDVQQLVMPLRIEAEAPMHVSPKPEPIPAPEVEGAAEDFEPVPVEVYEEV